MLVYVNGVFLPREEAKISVFDHGYLYGDGIYETLRCYRGTIFLLDRHLARLERSAAAIGLSLPLSLDAIGATLKETVAKNDLADAYVRMQISRGPGEIGLDPALCPAPTMVIVAKQFKEYPAALFVQGVSVSVVSTRRNHPLSLDPAVKSTNFLNNIQAKRESIARGTYEGIMLNWEGYVAEGTISNIFTVAKGVLRTPGADAGILEGVTRDLVLSLARRAGIPCEEPRLLPADLGRADECFLTNTTMEIMPVTTIDGQTVGTGAPGPVTRTLMQAYREEVLRHV